MGMTVTDQDRRLIPMLKPLIVCLNEMVSGPCLRNIKIILEQPYLMVYPIVSRMIDDLDHPFYELKNNVMVFLTGMTEGENPEALKRISKNLSVTILEETMI